MTAGDETMTRRYEWFGRRAHRVRLEQRVWNGLSRVRGHPCLSFNTRIAPASTSVTPFASITGSDWIMNP